MSPSKSYRFGFKSTYIFFWSIKADIDWKEMSLAWYKTSFNLYLEDNQKKYKILSLWLKQLVAFALSRYQNPINVKFWTFEPLYNNIIGRERNLKYFSYLKSFMYILNHFQRTSELIIFLYPQNFIYFRDSHVHRLYIDFIC